MPETTNAADAPEQGEKFDALLATFIDDLSQRDTALDPYREPRTTQVPAYQTIDCLSGREKAAFVRHLFGRIVEDRSYPERGTGVLAGEDGYLNLAHRGLFKCLMKGKVALDPEEALTYLAEFLDLNAKNAWEFRLTDFPFAAVTKQFERSMKSREFTQPLRERVGSILEIPAITTDRNDSDADMVKVRARLFGMVRPDGGASSVPVPRYTRLVGDPFGEAVTAGLAAMPEEMQPPWHTLLYETESVSGAKPPEKYLAAANELIDRIREDQYASQVRDWLRVATNMPIRSQHYSETYAGERHEYTQLEYLTANNRNLLRGLVWTLMRFDDAETLRVVAKFAARCFDVIPGKGPAAVAAGNACLLVLAEAEGLDGVSHLSRLKLRIRQPATRKLIQQYIEERAGKLGLKPATIEEVAAPDFDLDHGRGSEAFDDYTLTMTLSGIGKVDLQWLKPDGSPQKSAPAFVKSSKEHADRLKTLQATAKEIQQASTAQRDRIDRLFVEDMSWSYEDFRKFYLDHGVVSGIARKLIWQIVDADGHATDALHVDGDWQAVTGECVAPAADTIVRMWHPIDADPDTVLAWRDRLDALEITQPMKQAYREIYVVTDPELATRSYSNRMAAHILKQHQFSALAAGRGWNYSLLGANDDGRDNDAARRTLPAYGLTAEYWIDELHDDDRFNEAGIWDYVATDQVRFLDSNDNPMDVVDVPRIVFSEVMRDVDLFVGVAGVGNDPEWQDGGATREQQDYWQAYSFGDLTELAKTRKAVLERLLPRLRIRDQAHIDGKFLIVDGKRHSYKIHLGSTNILILPNDRYLCIVPGRGKDRNTDDIHLPFEGDRGLSIVLSKAFMLADDDKIADPSILSQL